MQNHYFQQLISYLTKTRIFHCAHRWHTFFVCSAGSRVARKIALLCCIVLCGYADNSPKDQSITPKHHNIQAINTESIHQEIASINDTLQKSNSLWLKRYTDHTNYALIAKEIQNLKDEILQIPPSDFRALNEKRYTLETLEYQLELLKDTKSNPKARYWRDSNNYQSFCNHWRYFFY